MSTAEPNDNSESEIGGPDSDKAVNSVDPESGELSEPVREQIAEFMMERYTSPFPHPDHLERYVALFPDAASVIFSQFAEQGTHRRKMEAQYMAGSERRANRGQWLAAGLVVLVIAAGAIAILGGQAVAGATVITAGLGGGILLSISGTRQRAGSAARQPTVSSSDRAAGSTQPINRPPETPPAI